MPLFLTIDCPHCMTAKVLFPVLKRATSKRNRTGLSIAKGGNHEIPIFESSYFAQCPICERCAILQVGTAGTEAMEKNINKALDDEETFILNGPDNPTFKATVYPEPPKPDLPANLPPHIARTYQEAEQCFCSGALNGAAAMYRKTVERAVVEIHPSAARAKMLGNKLAALEETGLLPDPMLDWIRLIKDDANFALHDNNNDFVNADQIRPARHFTKTLTMYLFTLPKMLEEAKNKQSAR